MMRIRPMEMNDIRCVTEWVQGEGWITEDEPVFRQFLSVEPGGCFIGEYNGRRAGMCTATAYDRFGFIGELIVAPEFRGRGMGGRLFSAAVEYLKGRGMESMALDADLSAVTLYERAGFRKVCRSLRYFGTPAFHRSDCIRDLEAGDWPAVLDLDRKAFGADRSRFLLSDADQEHCQIRVWEIAGQVKGFAVIRRARGVWALGPVIVSPAVSDPSLFLFDFAGTTRKAPIRLGVLETCTPAVRRLDRIPGMRRTEPSWRMITGPGTGFGLPEWQWAVGSPARG